MKPIHRENDHRIEWVAECVCATMGFGYDRQGYKCVECGEWFGQRLPEAPLITRLESTNEEEK